jgi:hypothetical protein
MGRTVAAYVELGRAATEAKDDPRYEKAAQAANEERAQLAPKVAFLDVRVTHATSETTLKVGADEPRRGGFDEPVPVLPGTAEVVVETPGRPPVRQQVQVAGGQHQSVDIDAGGPPPAPAPEAPDATAATEPAQPHASGPPLRPFAYASGGLAAVGLVTFVIAGSMANGTYSKLQKECGSGPCPAAYASDVSSGKSEQTFANVGLAVFVVGAAAGVTLFVIDSRRTAQSNAATAQVTVGPTFVGMKGAF